MRKWSEVRAELIANGTIRESEVARHRQELDNSRPTPHELIDEIAAEDAPADTSWVPGDPIYQDPPQYNHCNTCGCRWTGEPTACPECLNNDDTVTLTIDPPTTPLRRQS